MRVIKCVKRDAESNKLFSVISGKHPVGVEYLANKKVRAKEAMEKKGYYPLVFESLRDALRCARKYCWSCEFWEAEVKRDEVVRELPKMIGYVWELLISEGEVVGIEYIEEQWPEGTLMAKGVTLRKRLGNFEEAEKYDRRA